jgi:hypothetical protein
VPKTTTTWSRWLAAGLGLASTALWLVALAQKGPVWLTWPDAIVALFAFGTIGLTPEGPLAGLVAGACFLAAAGGLGVLWLVAVSAAAPAWLAWWNFGLACAFLLAAAAPLMAWLMSVGVPSIADRT